MTYPEINEHKKQIAKAMYGVWRTVCQDEWFFPQTDTDKIQYSDNEFKRELRFWLSGRKTPFIDPRDMNGFIEAFKHIPGLKLKRVNKKFRKAGSFYWYDLPVYEIDCLVFSY